MTLVKTGARIIATRFVTSKFMGGFSDRPRGNLSERSLIYTFLHKKSFKNGHFMVFDPKVESSGVFDVNEGHF